MKIISIIVSISSIALLAGQVAFAGDEINKLKQHQEQLQKQHQATQSSASLRANLVNKVASLTDSSLDKVFVRLQRAGVLFENPETALNDFNSTARFAGAGRFQLHTLLSAKHDNLLARVTDNYYAPTLFQQIPIYVIKPAGLDKILTIRFVDEGNIDIDAEGGPTQKCTVGFAVRKVNSADLSEKSLGPLKCLAVLDGSAIDEMANSLSGWIDQQVK